MQGYESLNKDRKFLQSLCGLRKFKQRQKRLKKHFIQKRMKILKIKCFM